MQNKRLRISYLVVLFLIASVTIVSYLLINQSIEQENSDVAIINMAGRQRMLSQKVTQLSLRYILAQDENATLTAELKRHIDEWQKTHHILRYGDVPNNFQNTLNNHTIDSLYVDMEPSYQQVIQSAKALLTHSTDNHDLIRNITDQQAIFLPKMEEIVKEYEDANEHNINRVQEIVLIGFGSIILLSLAEALFIFFPILKRNQHLFSELSNKNNLLKLQNNVLESSVIKEKENRLSIEENEAKFRFIAERTSDGIMVFEQGHITYTSPSYDKILGYSFKEASIRDEEAIFKLVHPDDVEKTKSFIKQSLAQRLDYFTYEFRAMHKAGYYVWREDTANIIYEEGVAVKMVIIARNINKRKQYERARIEREQLLSSIFDTVTDAIFVLDVVEEGYRFSLVNKTFKMFTGLSAGKLMESLLEEILPEPFFLTAITKINEAITEKKTVRWQETIDYPNHFFVGEINISPIYDVTGNCVRIIGTMYNQTDSFKAEEALKQSHERLLKLTEKVSAAIYEFEITEDGKTRFPFVSQYITKLFPEISIDHLKEDGSIAIAAVHPNDLPQLLASEEVSMKNLSVWNQEYRILDKDGTIRWVKGSAHPEKKPNGSVVWYGYLEDITQQKEEEKRLRLFESAISNSTEGVVISEVTDAETNSDSIIFANEAFCKMTGYSFDEISMELAGRLRGSLTDSQETARFEEAMRKGEPCEIEIINYKKTGEPFWVNIAIAPVYNYNRKITHWISIQRDVSQKKKDFQNIEDQNKRLKDIAWMQSHIVRAPLAKIMGLIDLLNNKSSLSREDKQYLNHINSSATELDNVIRAIVEKTDDTDIVS